MSLEFINRVEKELFRYMKEGYGLSRMDVLIIKNLLSKRFMRRRELNETIGADSAFIGRRLKHLRSSGYICKVDEKLKNSPYTILREDDVTKYIRNFEVKTL